MKVFVRRVLPAALAGIGLALGAGGAWGKTTSPFKPPAEKLGTYVIDDGAGLDTGCQFHYQGNLEVKFSIPSPVNAGMLNADGTLKDPAKLVSSGLIGAQAKISFPVYDVDSEDKTKVPEVDHLYLNGELIKTLKGLNNTWTDDSFMIDIGKLRFALPGQEKTVYNVFYIDIDTATSDRRQWCTGLDWIATDFEVAAPYVLIPGFETGKGAWTEADAPGVLKLLEAKGIRYKHFSAQDLKGSVADNANYLKEEIKAFLAPLKSTKVNVIAHGKGGFDAQRLATISLPEFEVLSLTTLGTPFLGSAVADVQAAAYDAVGYLENSTDPVDPKGYLRRYLDRRFAAQFGTSDTAASQVDELTTQYASYASHIGQRNSVPNLFTLGADAGPKCGRIPTQAELQEMLPDASQGVVVQDYALRLQQRGYKAACDNARVAELSYWLEPYSNPDLIPRVILSYDKKTLGAVQLNDAVVSSRSANPSWGQSLGNNADTNHAEIKNVSNIETSLGLTLRLR